MQPTAITLEIANQSIRLRVTMPGTLKGYTIIESVPFNGGKSLPSFRKHGAQYAKRFSIPFCDTTAKA